MRKTYIKNLLSINKKAFQFLHDVEGFDFENLISSQNNPENLPLTRLKRQ